MKFGIDSKQFLILEETLLKPLKSLGSTIWIFGSRARGDFREFSDVDLLFELPKGVTLPNGFLYDIKTNLDDSNFIYKVGQYCHLTKITKYILFAGISTTVNLGIQYASFNFYSGNLSLYVAMFWGTISGLVVKYILDKKYILYFKPKHKGEDRSRFVLYSLMGIVTTLIFWIVEASFDHLLNLPFTKYFGAILGLAIGYTVKYYLDKKYVFV